MTYQNSHSSGEIGSVSMALPLLGQIEIVVIIQVIGFNVGINAGASAGQTVFHVHLIPRRDVSELH
jgi:diadenosine tetraphosphate (Ap4A) HIT family hydrolase